MREAFEHFEKIVLCMKCEGASTVFILFSALIHAVKLVLVFKIVINSNRGIF